MNSGYRPPPSRGTSKATASTLCQKCLKRDDYECKTGAQERPYVARPSRTQQLLNPRLLPKLNSDVPNDLLRKKGIADEQLAQSAAERGRKRLRDAEDKAPSRNRSRSRSSMSTSSVSTISTTESRSPSPPAHPARRHDRDEYMSSQHVEDEKSGKRRRRSSSAASRNSDVDSDRNTRRRRNEFSPIQRGRRRSRSESGRNGSRLSRSRSDSRSRRGSKRISHSPKREEEVRRPRRSRSPFGRGGDGSGWRHRRDRGGHNGPKMREEPRTRPPPPKERSLSPFSKRLALTQAMNMGR